MAQVTFISVVFFPCSPLNHKKKKKKKKKKNWGGGGGGIGRGEVWCGGERTERGQHLWVECKYSDG